MWPILKHWIGNRGAIVALVVLQFVALAIAIYFTLPHLYKWHGDVVHYYNYSLNLLQGKWPYRDFSFEYPPLALLPIILPQLANLGQSPTFFSYVLFFLFQNALISSAIALSFDRWISDWQPWRSLVQTLIVYVLLVAIASPLLVWRYDLFPAVLTLFALRVLLRGRAILAGIWLGLGIAAKLYPVVLIPIFSAYYLASGKYRALLHFLGASIGATFLTLLPFLVTAPRELFSFLSYHQQRGLQIESLPAGLLILAHVMGLTPAKVVVNYGAFHLVSPLADGVIKCLPWVFILAFCGAIASCVSCFRHERAIAGSISIDSLVAYILVALLIFMVTNKVFSPQYLIWLLPFAPLVRRRQAWLLIAIYASTIIISPFAYKGLRTMQLMPVLLLNLRNILVVAFLLWLIIERLPVSRSGAIARFCAKVSCWVGDRIKRH